MASKAIEACFNSKTLCLIFSVLTISSMSVPAFAQDYQKGVNLFRKQDYRGASIEFVRVLRKDPNNSNATYYAAMSYQRLGNAVQAKRYYKELLTKFPGSKGAQYAKQALASMSAVQYSNDPATYQRNLRQGHGQSQAQSQSAGTQSYNAGAAQTARQPRMGAADDFIPDNEKVYFQNDPNGHPRLKCMVNGHPVNMLFDTGAEICAIDKDTARSIGLNVPADAPSHEILGSTGVENSKVVKTKIQLGKIKRTVPLMVLEKSNHQILGMPFFGDLQYRIDNSSHSISFAKEASSMSDYNTEDIPFTKRGHDIIVEVKVNGKPFPMCFDTGAAGTIFPGTAMAASGDSGWELVGSNTTSGIGGTSGAKGRYRINRLELGRIGKSNMEVVVDPVFPHPYGLLGQDFYGDKTYTIDQANSRIRMRR